MVRPYERQPSTPLHVPAHTQILEYEMAQVATFRGASGKERGIAETRGDQKRKGKVWPVPLRRPLRIV